MDKITVRLIGGPAIELEKGTEILTVANEFERLCMYKILAALCNNRLKELKDRLWEDCELEFLDITHPHGFRVYQKSAAFLMIYAAKAVLGRKAQIAVNHSINKNYYCEIRGGVEITEELAREIEAKMKETAAADLQIEKLTLPLSAGRRILAEFDNPTMIRATEYLRTANINLYKLDFYYDYFYGQIVPSTGYLKSFRLVMEDGGLMLQLPSSQNPEKMQEIKNLKKISQVFSESAKWARILKVDTVSALNDAVCRDEGGSVIRTNEALHEKSIAAIADSIHGQGKKIVLVAGPSSSGKTTFAERLCVQLRVLGLKPHIISLDNYFYNRDSVPLDEFGNPDFESVDFLDISLLNKDLSELLKGQAVDMPIYNFYSGTREYKNMFLKLEGNDVLVIEGIHGLNEAVTASVPKENKFKVFISALTQLNIDDHNRIPTSDTRLIRRIVRDNRSRGYDALKTLSMWGSVARGEEKNIFPFQEDADAIFNSALVYEMCILKQYAQPLLFYIDDSVKEYAEAKRLLKFLDSFVSMPHDDVPNNSILREFIGGSCFRT